jgi:hypothetical protein
VARFTAVGFNRGRLRLRGRGRHGVDTSVGARASTSRAAEGAAPTGGRCRAPKTSIRATSTTGNEQERDGPAVTPPSVVGRVSHQTSPAQSTWERQRVRPPRCRPTRLSPSARRRRRGWWDGRDNPGASTALHGHQTPRGSQASPTTAAQFLADSQMLLKRASDDCDGILLRRRTGSRDLEARVQRAHRRGT